MFMVHFVILKDEPSDARLATLRDGYQLWRESRTGLFFLTAHSEPLGKRPDFSGDLWREASHKADIAWLREYMADETAPASIQKIEVNFDLVHLAVTLSIQLATQVLVAESTDDEYAMAVAADRGEVTYVRFRTLLKDGPDEHGAYTGAEVVFTPDSGFSVCEPTNAFCGVAEAGIEQVFGLKVPDLYNFTDAKPTREQAKDSVKGGPLSATAYLDSFGVFKRLSHRGPQHDWKARAMMPFRYAVSSIMLPFILTGTIVLAMSERGSRVLSNDPSLVRIMLVGALVLAMPTALIVLVIRWLAGL